MEPIINQEQFLPIIQKESGRGGEKGGRLFNSQWERRKREENRVRLYMKNRYEERRDKEEEGGKDGGMWDRLDDI